MKIVECKSAGCLLPENIAREVDDLYKTLPTGCEYRTKAYNADLQFEPNERAEVSIITTNKVDYSNEVVKTEGIDLELYRRGDLQVLWNHQRDLPEIGRCKWIKPYHNQLRAKTEYPEHDTEQFIYNKVWDLIADKVLNFKSIGFQPRTPLRDPTHEELDEHPEWQGVGVWDDVVLLEYSLVPLPCNSGALVEMVNNKSLDEVVIKSLGLEMPEQEVKAYPVEQVVEQVKCQCHKIDARQAALEYLKTHPQPQPKKKKAKPPVDVSKLIAKALDELQFDVNKIVNAALAAYRTRGQV